MDNAMTVKSDFIFVSPFAVSISGAQGAHALVVSGMVS
jgi:hypothetical protein